MQEQNAKYENIKKGQLKGLAIGRNHRGGNYSRDHIKIAGDDFLKNSSCNLFDVLFLSSVVFCKRPMSKNDTQPKPPPNKFEIAGCKHRL
jgi:hypothetical protein